jgi:site-specific DNA-methyltransferase (cytosine-N4-specific)
VTPFVADGDFTLHVGNALDVLQGMPDESVHCVVTSPPYWGLRDYGTGSWVGGDPDCDHRKNAVTGRGEDFRKRGEDRGYAKGSNFANYGDRNATASDFEDTCGKCGATRTDQQLGLEPTPDAYITRMVEVFREVRRVLRRDGTCWLNIGDSYSGGSGSNVWSGDAFESDGSQRGQQPVRGKERRTPVVGMKPKDLVGIPWRLAFALQADGWYLRSDIIWAKPNPMPESVTDRPTKAHEYVFLLTREARYFYDADAIREPAEYGRREWSDPEAVLAAATNGNDKRPDHGVRVKASVTGGDPSAGRNARSVWTIATQPYAEAHFACVDAETEALTPNGWAGLDDLSDGDLIAAYNPGSDECLFEPATFHHYDYDGELVVIEKRDSSQRLTPSHTCPVRYRSGLQATVAASDLKPGMEVMTAAPLVVAARRNWQRARLASRLVCGRRMGHGWAAGGSVAIGACQRESLRDD